MKPKNKGILVGEVGLLYLEDSSIAIIDADDFERVMARRWRRLNTGYVGHSYKISGCTGAQLILLHRFVMNAEPGEFIDHENGFPLDCRKSNLRRATKRQNNVNRRCWKRKAVQVKGVAWDEKYRKWRARICLNGKSTWLGRFDTLKEASDAYNRAAVEKFGQFARLN